MTIIVLDTNVWISTRLLTSAGGKALLHAIILGKHKIGLPECVEREMARTFPEMMEESASRARSELLKLDSFLGTRLAGQIPTEVDLRSAIVSLLKDIEPLLIRSPISDQHLRDASEMVFSQVPPNTPKSQQFKDSLIWRSVIDLVGQMPVLLLTEDSGFYQDQDRGTGLAQPLQAEVESLPYQAHALSRINEALDFLDAPSTSPPEVSVEELTRLIMITTEPYSIVGDRLEDLEPLDVRLGRLRPTEEEGVGSVEFSANFEAFQRHDGLPVWLAVDGMFLYDGDPNRLLGLDPWRWTISINDEELDDDRLVP